MVEEARVPSHVAQGVEHGLGRVVGDRAALNTVERASLFADLAPPSRAVVLMVAVAEVREHGELAERGDPVLADRRHLQLGAWGHLRSRHLAAVADAIAGLPWARVQYISVTRPLRLGGRATVRDNDKAVRSESG